MFFSFVLLCFVSYFIFIGFLGYHFVLHIFLFLSLRITIYIPKLSHSAYMDLMLHNVENLMMPYSNCTSNQRNFFLNCTELLANMAQEI